MTITKCVRCTHRDDAILVLQTQVSDGENSVNQNTIQLSKETSNLDETSQTSVQTIISQTNYDEDHLRISSHRLKIS